MNTRTIAGGSTSRQPSMPPPHHHSTETAMLKILNDVYTTADRQCSTCFVALDLSAAFDILDHTTIIDRLCHTFGIESSAIDWLKSNLINRSQFVKFGNVLFPHTNCSIGIPQGSVLGPILFSLFISPVAGVISNFGVRLFSSICGRHTTLYRRQPKIHCQITRHPGQMQSYGPRLVHKQWPGVQPNEVQNSLHGHHNEATFSQEHCQGISDRMWYIASWDIQKSQSDTGLRTLPVQTCQQHL